MLCPWLLWTESHLMALDATVKHYNHSQYMQKDLSGFIDWQPFSFSFCFSFWFFAVQLSFMNKTFYSDISSLGPLYTLMYILHRPVPILSGFWSSHNIYILHWVCFAWIWRKMFLWPFNNTVYIRQMIITWSHVFFF